MNPGLRVLLIPMLWTSVASSAVSLPDQVGSVRDRSMAGAGLALDRDPGDGWRNPATLSVGNAVGFGGIRTFDGAGAMALMWRGGSGRGAWMLGAAGYDAGSMTLNGEDGSSRILIAERAEGFIFGGSYRRGPVAFGASLLQGGGTYVGIDRRFSEFNVSGLVRFGDHAAFAVVAHDPLFLTEEMFAPGYPAVLEVGAAGPDLIGLPVVEGRVSVAAAATWDRVREATSVSAGLEATAHRFAVRMGARGGSVDRRVVWTAGLGARFGRWVFDYAIELTPPDGALIPHAAGLTYAW